MDLPKQVLEVMDKLSSYGYDAYIFGECVRLLIKGKTLVDFDIVTNAEIGRIAAIFEGYNVNADNLDRGELLVRVLGVAVNVKSRGDLKRELKNNGFTFDAVAYNREKGFADPFGGLNHINENTVAFIDDSEVNPLDIIPALGWYSEDEYTILDSTKAAVLDNHGKLAEVPDEITREDFQRVLMGKKAGAVLAEFRAVFETVVPELAMLRELPETERLAAHTFKSVGCSSPILNLRYALFFHEFGKPDCFSRDSEDTPHFYGHAQRASIYARRIMTRLGCSKDDINEVCDIIENYFGVTDTEYNQVADLLDRFSPALLKLLFLFNCADFRALRSEKAEQVAMKYKKLAGMVG